MSTIAGSTMAVFCLTSPGGDGGRGGGTSSIYTTFAVALQCRLWVYSAHAL